MQNGDADWVSAILLTMLLWRHSYLRPWLGDGWSLIRLQSLVSIMSGRGNILQSALQAGGMSLVTQLVNDGEIDWKYAASGGGIAP